VLSRGPADEPTKLNLKTSKGMADSICRLGAGRQRPHLLNRRPVASRASLAYTAGSQAIPCGSDLVRMGGDPGEHDIDVGDLSTLVPSVTSGGGGTSREQLIAHEIVEAIRELELAPYVTSLDEEERDDAWMLAHEDALDMENQFRSEAGVPGLLIDRTVVAISPGGAALVTDSYDNGHMDFWYP